MAKWLLKSEPEEYAYSDLVHDGQAEWDGVTAPPAQKNLRAAAVGDECIFYHTGNERRAVGICAVARAGYPDPTDPTGKRVWIDVRPLGELPKPVSLSTLRDHPAFAGSPLLRLGRLSVVPLTDEQFNVILELGGYAGPRS